MKETDPEIVGAIMAMLGLACTFAIGFFVGFVVKWLIT